MPYPDQTEFALMLRERNHEELVEDLLRGIPFAFEGDPGLYGTLLGEISAALEIEQETITLVGSGRIGFSLAPEKYGTPFSDKSDLDMAIINADLFDQAWREMIRLGDAYYTLRPAVREWLKAHRQNHVFWGIIYPDRLPGIVTLSSKWFSAFKGLSRNPTFAKRQTTGRLYRTREHLVVHQMYSCRAIVRELASAKARSEEASRDIHR